LRQSSRTCAPSGRTSGKSSARVLAREGPGEGRGGGPLTRDRPAQRRQRGRLAARGVGDSRRGEPLTRDEARLRAGDASSPPSYRAALARQLGSPEADRAQGPREHSKVIVVLVLAVGVAVAVGVGRPSKKAPAATTTWSDVAPAL